MTEEELIKEATSTTAWRCITMIDRPLFVRGYIMGAEPREKRIVELEKENAELKSIADFQTSSNMDRYFQLKRSKERLTKAKEIIKELLKALDGRNGFDEDVFGRAEQFLKEK